MSIDISSLYWKILTVFDILGCLLNAILLYLAFFKTPSNLRIYKILIINFAFTDFFAAALNFFVQQRIIPILYTIGYVSHGACRYFGSFVCFFSHSVMSHLIVHSNYSLLFAFAYRYYILIRPEPTRRQVIIALLVVYSPSLFLLIAYQFARGEPANIIRIIQENAPEYNLKGQMITGVEDIRSIAAQSKIFQLTVMAVPVFIGILVFRRLIIKKLVIPQYSISVSTKVLHSQLLMALTYQAFIPVILFVSVAMYVLEQFGIYRSELMENYIMTGLVLIPVFGPISYFIFLTPYRKFLFRTKRTISDRDTSISRSVQTAKFVKA
ncbi:unnamed protein product [Caenorhabditis bovis]|uniref:G-protein coupled receptors family 1 profile domain-containing protein n=1 Tax=Caenorhabditis bovis TaxID=2654633 RepID=A0A8S1F417_9PELO|nr:unnamed protein product [Caenorhabditis bovis]